jgi:hypothetical protein
MKRDLTYCHNDKLGAVDFSKEQANSEIDKYDAIHAKIRIDGMVYGLVTFEDALRTEIDFHQEVMERCKELGFGNSVRFAIHCIKVLESFRSIGMIDKQEQQTENDLTFSTIEDWLFEFKKKMSENDYKNLVSALMQYFETGTFPTLLKPIQINGRPNKKLFGWALNRIFEYKSKGVEKELLQFAKQNISLFTDVQFDENNIMKSNLYKYFTTKTK